MVKQIEVTFPSPEQGPEPYSLGVLLTLHNQLLVVPKSPPGVLGNHWSGAFLVLISQIIVLLSPLSN